MPEVLPPSGTPEPQQPVPIFDHYVKWLDAEIANHVSSHNYRGTAVWSALAASFAVLFVANGANDYQLGTCEKNCLIFVFCVLGLTAGIFIWAQYRALSIAADRAREFRRAKTQLLARALWDSTNQTLSDDPESLACGQWPKLFEAIDRNGHKCKRTLNHRKVSECACYVVLVIVTGLACYSVHAERCTDSKRHSIQTPSSLPASDSTIKPSGIAALPGTSQSDRHHDDAGSTCACDAGV
jgi:hypothetical protein